MTLTDVATAALALAAAGTVPSGNTIVRYLQEHGVKGNKKMALRLLKQLPHVPQPAPTPAVYAEVAEVLLPLAMAPDDPVFHGQPVVVPAPPPLDPVARAQARLEHAEL